MQYQVPQFIEVEDKIFGPLTFKQFVYLVGGGAISYISYRFFPFFISILIIIPVLSLSVALAFYKVNRKPFLEIMISAIKFLFTNKLYIWEKSKDIKKEVSSTNLAPKMYVPKLSESKLRDLTWSLDINESVYNRVNNTEYSKMQDLLRPEFNDNEL